MQRYRDDGTIAPRKIGGSLKQRPEPHYDRVWAFFAQTPGITIDELQLCLAA